MNRDKESNNSPSKKKNKRNCSFVLMQNAGGKTSKAKTYS